MEAQKELQENKKPSYFVKIKSAHLPFVIDERDFKEIEKANFILQKFVRYIEKKFDTVWYIGSDIFGPELYERFIFQHGGFMEISFSGEINIYLIEDKISDIKEALRYAIEKTLTRNMANRLVNELYAGQKLISVQDSLKY